MTGLGRQFCDHCVTSPAWATGRDGEDAARASTGVRPADRVVISMVPRRSRVHDGSDTMASGRLRNHEVEMGRTDRTSDVEQCRKDGGDPVSLLVSTRSTMS